MGTTPNAGAGAAAPPRPAADGDAAVVAGRGALFIGFAKIYFMLSGSLQQVLLPHVLRAAQFGAFSVINNIISIVNNTVVQATVQSVSKFSAEDDAAAGPVQRTGVRVQLVFGLALAAVLVLVAPAIASFLKAPPQYTNYLRLATLVPLFYCVYAVFVGSANGLRRFRTQASFDVGFSTMKTILLLALAALFGVTGAFAGFALAALAILVISSRVMRLPRPAGAAAFPLGRLAPYMAAVSVYALLLNLALNYDSPLLHHFAGVVDAQRAPPLVAHYQALRTLALLPYQALIVVTFVIFPLVSRATFAEDQEATRVYVTQTLRYALLLAVAMGLALAARPGALLAILYKAEYGEGASALPILVTGECCLALLAVSCAILNAAGRTIASVSFMALTVATGAAATALLVPHAAPGPAMLVAEASATSLGMAAGFVASLVYLRVRLGGGAPTPTVVRVAVAAAAAVVVGRFLPGHGRVLGLAAVVAVAVVYLAVLIALGEFTAADRAKFRRVLRR
jgi:O-antigen/teichoic acid export membrane protein